MSATNLSNSKVKLQHGKISKELPKTEKQWTVYTTLEGKQYVITSTLDRRDYFLYTKSPDGYQKIAKAPDPTGFDNMME
ncbi:MAG TPA: hypothetical protein PLT28_00245 [Saprospiraceae bacterium]|nr:hypothetical protein [Saprospiraceae bacterium]